MGMTEKAINNSAGGFLILILPIAFLIMFLFAAWPVLLAILLFSAIWNVWQRYRWQKWSQQVNPIFNQLIQENRGSITALDLAMKANFSATTAKHYLDTKAEEFGAQRQDYEDRGTVYYFITASTLGKIFDDSELPITNGEDVGERTKDEKAFSHPYEASPEQLLPHQNQSVDLIQSELAKRLDVHSSTVYKRRDDPDFAEWSRSRDPEGIAWKYLPDNKHFSPLEAEPRLEEVQN